MQRQLSNEQAEASLTDCVGPDNQIVSLCVGELVVKYSKTSGESEKERTYATNVTTCVTQVSVPYIPTALFIQTHHTRVLIPVATSHTLLCLHSIKEPMQKKIQPRNEGP